MPPERIPPLVRERLGKVERQVGRLCTLVEELLDVSRIRAGRLTLQREELDFAALVREAVERHCGTIRVDSCLGKGATFIAELPCEPQARVGRDGARVSI